MQFVELKSALEIDGHQPGTETTQPMMSSHHLGESPQII